MKQTRVPRMKILGVPLLLLLAMALVIALVPPAAVGPAVVITIIGSLVVMRMAAR